MRSPDGSDPSRRTAAGSGTPATAMTRAGVPDGLLGPLLDTAAEVLRALAPDQVPAGLRALAGFDRRGLANATARQQLRRAVDLDPEFRARAVEAFGARPEVRAVLDAWSAEGAIDSAADAADRGDLSLWTAALYAAEPPGAEFGLGVACSEDRHRRVARVVHDDAEAASARIATAEEAQRRAEGALAEAHRELTRLGDELRDERRSRRDREVDAERRAEAATQAVREAEAVADRARRDGDLAEARARREADRAREAERRLRERARETAMSTRADERGDAIAIAEAADAARALSARLDALSRAARAQAERAAADDATARATTAATGRSRRAAVPCPPGLHADQPEALEAMLRTSGLVLLVDGYNVTMAGWPDASASRQRDQLVSALHRLHLRLRSHAIVVFDGADVEGVPAPRATGVRVMFSPSGTPADSVIIDELASLPDRVPVVVVSSDGWVRTEAERGGARAVRSDALLAVLRR